MSSSKIIIGLYHYPHVNFFKNAITVLKNLGHKIEVVLRDRGDLIPIFEKEIPSVPFKVIGKHRKTTINKFRELLRNDLETINYLRNKDYDIVTGVSGINLSHAARLLGKPSIMFDDDPQDYTTFELYRLFTDRIILPKYTTAAGLKIKKYNGFKELAHLHPKYFEPNRDILKRYDLKAEKYVFVREQAPISIVYRHSFVGELYNYTKFLRNQGYKIILSLEDKKNAKIYGKVGQVLEEPVEDFHSLIYYAAFTLSTGDSLARESVLLGTPSIYTGKRNMPINTELIKRGFLNKADTSDDILCALKDFISMNYKKKLKTQVHECINREWDNTTDFIVSEICEMLERNKS